MSATNLSAPPASTAANNGVCPSCGATGKPVKAATLQSLLKPEALARVGSAAYRFCPSERCNVVYFAESGGTCFTKADLTVRVGIKETTPPREVCYCFNHTIEQIEDEVQRTGETTVLEDIKTRMKETCWCETKSPIGSCCLATVTKYVKAAQARYAGKEAPISVTDEHEDCCAAHKAETKSETTAPVSSSTTRVSKGERIAWVGSLASAVVASACCWLPLLLLAFGVSGVAVSAPFEKYRPLFATLTFGFLAAAFYLAYRPRPKTFTGAGSQGDACCATPAAGEGCCPPTAGRRGTLQKFNRVMLWPVTAVALAFVFFPNYVGTLLGGRDSAGFSPYVEQYVVSVDGMDCAACAAGLEKQLQTVPGVGAVKVNYEKKEAIIGVTKGASAPIDKVLAAISRAGFTGHIVDMRREP